MGFGHHGLGGCGCCVNECGPGLYPNVQYPDDSFNSFNNEGPPNANQYWKTQPSKTDAYYQETEATYPNTGVYYGFYSGSPALNLVYLPSIGDGLNGRAQMIWSQSGIAGQGLNNQPYTLLVLSEYTNGFPVYSSMGLLPLFATLKSQLFFDNLNGYWHRNYFLNGLQVASYPAPELTGDPDQCGIVAYHGWQAWASRRFNSNEPPIPPGICTGITCSYQETEI